MQRIQPREAQDEESPAVKRAIGDSVAIFPEEYETADAPEYPDRIRTAIVERTEQPMKRQAIQNQIHFPVANESELAIVKYQNGKGRQEAQQLQSRKLVRSGGSSRWLYFDRHRTDAPCKTARSHSSYPAVLRCTPSIVCGVGAGDNAAKVAPPRTASSGRAEL